MKENSTNQHRCKYPNGNWANEVQQNIKIIVKEKEDES